MDKKDIERQIVSQKIHCYIQVYGEVLVNTAIEQLQKGLLLIPDECRETATIIYSAFHTYDEIEISVDMYYKRLENDKEWNVRLKEIDAKELAEQRLYEQLKIKYEK